MALWTRPYVDHRLPVCVPGSSVECGLLAARLPVLFISLSGTVLILLFLALSSLFTSTKAVTVACSVSSPVAFSPAKAEATRASRSATDDDLRDISRRCSQQLHTCKTRRGVQLRPSSTSHVDGQADHPPRLHAFVPLRSTSPGVFVPLLSYRWDLHACFIRCIDLV